MSTRRVYLDHLTTTPLLPQVREAMAPYWSEAFGSPASLHSLGLQARDALDLARHQFAALVNAEADEDIIFTGGGTEAVNLAIKGAAWAGRRLGQHIVTTAIEHPAVTRALGFLEEEGFRVTRVPVDAEGFISPQTIAEALTDQTVLVCVHLANHDLGTLQPIAQIGQVTSARGVPLFVDACIAGGWVPIDVQAWGVDLLALSPHRFYGPKGVGVLYRHRRARMVSLVHGGAQEGGRRAGTENVPGIVGAGVAAEAARLELVLRVNHTRTMQTRLWEGIRARIPLVRLNGPPLGPQRLCTHLNVSIEFVEGEGLMLRSDLQGLAFASGTVCASKAMRVSPALQAVGLPHSLAQAAILLSPGKDTTAEEIDRAVEVLADAAGKLRAMSPAWEAYQAGRLDSIIAPRRDKDPAGR